MMNYWRREDSCRVNMVCVRTHHTPRASSYSSIIALITDFNNQSLHGFSIKSKRINTLLGYIVVTAV